MDNTGYVVAGYVVTVMSLAGYLLRLRMRARSARARTEALAARKTP